MRDIVFLVVSAYLVFLSLKKPYVAISLWLWVGLFVPVHWLYGMAQGISFNSIFAFTALVGYLFQSNKKKLDMTLGLTCVVLFWLHTSLTSLLTIGIPDLVWDEWLKLSKKLLLVMMIILCVRKKNELELLCWVIVLSIGFLGVVESLKFIVTGGGHKIVGPQGHLLSDNNHFAVALCMLIPINMFLIQVTSSRWLKIGLIGILCLCIIAVLGTHSRGGFIGLLVVGGYYWFRSNHKFLVTSGILIVTAIAALYLSQDWYSRMNTIETATEDNSFITRLNSWKVHTLLAMDRPLLGGGFKTGSYGYIWQEKAQEFDKLDFIDTPLPTDDSGWAAHSIYFQVLGDHGALGLVIYLTMMASCFFRLGWVANITGSLGEAHRWRAHLARMLQLTIIAYGTAGAAVSLAYLEFFWAIIGISISLIISTRHLVDEKSDGKRLPFASIWPRH
ncbi:putative O-glycosylation ligase, exosortase A system-associated [Photobacterium proteolyticum]|uniref:Putative O-glycosylation ligase, exosortase A system-associated n=1 Tax=Photobacterium proteolyticum TaxID=1903952 RepID=A0A1Q9GLT2_9GAMM|nr:putative O-glycosylation ligase, exosortase A system-associated [Photobacterium proteolyticum]OLQ75515.1 putative O-glycosylation ligase, exosortase A system-associated [Photobacterium proteolyticum]